MLITVHICAVVRGKTFNSPVVHAISHLHVNETTIGANGIGELETGVKILENSYSFVSVSD